MNDINVYGIPGFREPVSCLTHLIAAVVFTIVGYHLVKRGRGSWLRTLSLSVMVFSSVFLLSMSAVYHMLGPGTGRYVMRQLDIAAIFVLIAGTVTPVHAILFTGINRWGPIFFAWLVAAAGITLRTVFSESLPDGVGTGIFVLLGWGGVISFTRLWKRYGFAFVEPLLWGGVAYTLGAIFLGLRWPTLIPNIVTAHEVWHIAVLVGLSLHWFFVFQFASGPPDINPKLSSLPT